MDPIKTGDTPTLTWTLDPAPAGGATVRVKIRHVPSGVVVVDREGDLSGDTVTLDLTADETARAGTHYVEVHVTSGSQVVTYPNSGVGVLEVEQSLG